MKLLPNTPSYLFGATPLLLLLDSRQETGEQQVVTTSGTNPVQKWTDKSLDRLLKHFRGLIKIKERILKI
jgi:hypothetical protein